MSWLDQLGLSRLIYRRVLQGRGFEPCSLLQLFKLHRTPSLQERRLFSDDLFILKVKCLIPYPMSTLSSKIEQKTHHVIRAGANNRLSR